MSLTDKVALITGAAQGLGRAFAEILLKNGAKVALTDINTDNGTQTLSELKKTYGEDKAIFVQCDVTSKTQMEDTFKTVTNKFGCLDIMINNAGIGLEMNDLWEKTIDINIKGTVRGTMLAIESMRRDKKGHGGVIVNVSSMAGVNPNPCGPVYGATKSAIINFSQSWSRNPELLSNGVRINVLAPAFAGTDLMAKLADKSTIYVPAMVEHIIAKVGIMSPETVAEALLELITDPSKNGAVLKISKVAGKEYQLI